MKNELGSLLVKADRLNFFNLDEHNLPQYVEEIAAGPNFWCFHHIPKTAGSSLGAEMSTRLAPYHNILPVYSETAVRHDEQMALAMDAFLGRYRNGETFNSASGHLFRRHVDEIAATIQNFRCFTFFRHPEARVISEYFYSCSERHPPHKEFRERFPTLLDFVNSPSEQNKMCQYLFSHGEMPESDEDLKEFLGTRYELIGLQERYPVSYVLLSALWGAPGLPKQQTNVAESKPEIDAETRTQIRANNKNDERLFQLVADVYDRISPAIWSRYKVGSPAES